jgi:hypothetical protein
MSSDLILSYSGGSGGYLLLHFLLLTKKYYCSFDQDNDLISQWQITDPSKWKSTEIKPNNINTLSSTTTKSKIYFFCNPTEDMLLKYSGKSIVIYTSLANQIEMANYKRAHWFMNKNEFGINRDFVKSWRAHYNNIKDASWPACPRLKQFNCLPQYIQKELLNDTYTKTVYPTQSIKNILLAEKSTIVNNTKVYSEIANFIIGADIAIKLEDFVNNYGEKLLKSLELPPINDCQRHLINNWKRLHPKTLLKKINILF